VDFENSQPNFIHQFAEKNNLPHQTLKGYCENRTSKLQEIMRSCNCSRDAAKNLVVTICYDKKPSLWIKSWNFKRYIYRHIPRWVFDLQGESGAIAAFVSANITTIFPGVYIPRDSIVPGITDSIVFPRLRASRLLAALIRDLERRQIMYVFHFLSNLCGYEVSAVISDGLLIRSNKKGNQIMDSDTFLRELIVNLKKADEYAFTFTDYRIHTDIKPMDDYIPILNTPRDAAEALVRICPGRIVYDEYDMSMNGEGTLLIYNDELRQWNSSTRALYKLIESKKFYMGDYAIDTEDKGIQPHLRYLPGVCINGFVENKQRSVQGLLLFQNGIYNMFEGTLQTEEVQDPQDFILRNMIPYNFPLFMLDENNKLMITPFDDLCCSPEDREEFTNYESFHMLSVEFNRCLEILNDDMPQQKEYATMAPYIKDFKRASVYARKIVIKCAKFLTQQCFRETLEETCEKNHATLQGPDMSHFLALLLGLGLAGQAYLMKTILFCIGQSDDAGKSDDGGKSALMQMILTAGGDNANTFDAQNLTTASSFKYGEDAEKKKKEWLLGQRLCTLLAANGMQRDAVLDSDELNTLTGGDSDVVHDNGISKNSISSFVVTALIILFANNPPRINKINNGLTDRVLQFIFPNTFVSSTMFKHRGSNENWKLRIDNIKEMFHYPMMQYAASYVFMSTVREFIESGGTATQLPPVPKCMRKFMPQAH
jgi:hypothetical protein